MPSPRRTLTEVLSEAQRLGTLGDRPIDEVIDHARRFVPALEGVTGRVLDIGTGAGVPGLVIAEARPDLRLTLLDRRQTRTDALRLAVTGMGLEGQVEVITGDTDVVAKDPTRTGAYSAVVARGFGPPRETAREARPFLVDGGILVVSEPPEWDPNRWPSDDLRSLGFGPAERLAGVVRITLGG